MEQPNPATKIKSNYESIQSNINNAKTKNVIFIAVSKRRTPELIQHVYDCGHREFGENYVAELLEKYEKLPKDIEWRLIGHLQTNKIKKLLETIPNIIIESIDSVKLALELQKQALKLGISNLRVYVEINISNSTTKTGADLNVIDDIVKTIIEHCPNLKLVGIMSLGNIGNKDEFKKMVEIKNKYCEMYKINKEEFVASFGTSDDYVNAIECGSDEVRVGSSIFAM
jgi:pyridoxal phosphate enzyme (YggS family)